MKQLLIFIFLPFTGYAQNSIEAVIDQIKFDGDSIESVFKYVATSITYDTEFIDAPLQYHSYEEVINDVLNTRKGVCMHYAYLFDALVKKLGYKSYIISGYTKFMNEPNSPLPHAWNAVQIKEAWYLFDPTWASGFVAGEKFYPQYEPLWFKRSPEEFIYSHIPFDPMWQFRNNPSSHNDILKNIYEGSNPKPVDYEAMRREYSAAGELEKLQISLKNITDAGITNRIIQNKIKYLQEQIKINQHNQQVISYNKSIGLLKEAKKEYAIYLAAKRASFKEWTVEDITTVTESFSKKVKTAHDQLSALQVTDEGLKNSIKKNMELVNVLISTIEREAEYLKKPPFYLNTYQ